MNQPKPKPIGISISQLLNCFEASATQPTPQPQPSSSAESRMPSDHDLKRATRLLEIDLAKERVEPYIVDMSKQMPDIEPLISINGCCVCSRGNISAICGEAKSRKTFLTSALVASAMAIPAPILDNFEIVDKNMDIEVLWIDTEQGEQHVRRVVERISAMTGAKAGGAISEPRLTTLALRELDPKERKQMMYDALRLKDYDIIVIDGIADLQRNTNDLEESDALIGELMALSTHTRSHIVCVLHTNPGSDKARGHLGSSLQRKAESVIFVHRVGDSSVVEPQFCRNEPFERFAFAISEEGIPQLCNLPSDSNLENPVVTILRQHFSGAVERTTLATKCQELLGITSDNARMKIHRLVKQGTLTKDDGNIIRLPH
ncbi:MAG: AAA family ATPase, partial [Alistipes sp.]|nr:AAA family ATPase [Alistipes sp.]